MNNAPNATSDTLDTFNLLQSSSCPEGSLDSASGGGLVELAEAPLSPQVAFPGLVDYRVGLTNLVTMEGPVDGLTSAPTVSESVENLSDVEKACLEAMKEDFYRGIVLIDDHANEEMYQAAFRADKTAGQSWEAIQERLLTNRAALLKKAVELSKLTGYEDGKGALLVGVYTNGELAIRQRSGKIVNARWTKDWRDGDPENQRGELVLLPHSEAVSQKTGRWAKAVEIIRAVKAAGYHVAPDAPDRIKKGLVAAYENRFRYYVTGLNNNDLRLAILECPDDVRDSDCVRAVYYRSDYSTNSFYCQTYIESCPANRRDHDGRHGAILWVIG